MYVFWRQYLTYNAGRIIIKKFDAWNMFSVTDSQANNLFKKGSCYIKISRIKDVSRSPIKDSFTTVLRSVQRSRFALRAFCSNNNNVTMSSFFMSEAFEGGHLYVAWRGCWRFICYLISMSLANRSGNKMLGERWIQWWCLRKYQMIVPAIHLWPRC